MSILGSKNIRNQYIEDNYKTGKDMEKELCSIKKKGYMKVIGKMMFVMEKVMKGTQIITSMKEIL
jgi:hypothetical protein